MCSVARAKASVPDEPDLVDELSEFIVIENFHAELRAMVEAVHKLQIESVGLRQVQPHLL